MQLFGDNNTLVRYAHSCVIITKKLHLIPYDTVPHWNSVVHPSVFTNNCSRDVLGLNRGHESVDVLCVKFA